MFVNLPWVANDHQAALLRQELGANILPKHTVGIEEIEVVELGQLLFDSQEHVITLERIVGPSQICLFDTRNLRQILLGELLISKDEVVPLGLRHEMSFGGLEEFVPELDVLTGTDVENGNLLHCPALSPGASC